MGASGWSYFVPYQEDIELAFNELRERVYKEGGYHTVFKTPGDRIAHAKAYLDRCRENDSDEISYAESYYQETLDKFQNISNPQSIEEEISIRIALNKPDGTHSILDIEGISEIPELGKVSPCPEDQLVEIFGVTMPGHGAVEEKEFVLQSLNGRWQGVYVIVYKNDQPVEIFFTGYSGD